jgi:tetratricopeptide (TPR) repeat protein
MSGTPTTHAPRLVGALCGLALAALVALAFAPALDGAFLEWDDRINFVDNAGYRGLAPGNLRWMFTTFLLGPYQPLSWLSLAVEGELFGYTAEVHHAGNVVWHALGALVFGLVARRLIAAALGLARTDALAVGAGWLAAGLFALHPLRVESVAWATERRDVLSGFLTALTVLAYLRAVERGRTRGARGALTAGDLVLVTLAFAASLLAKASGMTLPLVLLVLDAWPLGRFAGATRRERWGIVLEKLPLVAVSAAAGALALHGQEEADAFWILAHVGPLERLAIAGHASLFYVWKTLVPVGLSPNYMLPFALEFGPRHALAPLGVAALVVLAVALRRRAPWVLAALAAYLVLLAPVSGLRQAGLQIAADRYSHLPGMVLAVALAGLVAAFATRTRRSAAVLVAAGLVACALVPLTRAQTRHWRDPEALWRRVLAIEPANPLAHNNLGVLAEQRGDEAAALAHYEAAVRALPVDAGFLVNLAEELRKLGRREEGVAVLLRAVAVAPTAVDVRLKLARQLAELGRAAETADALREACRLRPQNASLALDHARARAALGERDVARSELERILALEPARASVLDEAAELARVLGDEGLAARFEERRPRPSAPAGGS